MTQPERRHDAAAAEPVRERILVRAPNWAGDLVMATPAFRALRAARPRAWIALHVRASLAPLLHGAPWFDEILSLESHRRGLVATLREALALRARRFDFGLCLPDSFSSALLMRVAGVRRVAGYATDARRPLLHAPVSPPEGLLARERQLLELLGALGIPARGTHLELFTTAAEEASAEALLGQHGVQPGAVLAALAPGASYGSSKLWPPESFARVGDALAAAGARVAIVGAPGETVLAGRVAAAMRAPVADLVGRIDLGSTKAVLRRARVLVCNDAGARHVAVAFGVPAVVLFGPTSLAKTNLNLERVRALWVDVECRPCYLRVCPIDHRCMTRLDPDRVARAALPALAGGFRGDAALSAAGVRS